MKKIKQFSVTANLAYNCVFKFYYFYCYKVLIKNKNYFKKNVSVGKFHK